MKPGDRQSWAKGASWEIGDGVPRNVGVGVGSQGANESRESLVSFRYLGAGLPTSNVVWVLAWAWARARACFLLLLASCSDVRKDNMLGYGVGTGALAAQTKKRALDVQRKPPWKPQEKLPAATAIGV